MWYSNKKSKDSLFGSSELLLKPPLEINNKSIECLGTGSNK